MRARPARALVATVFGTDGETLERAVKRLSPGFNVDRGWWGKVP